MRDENPWAVENFEAFSFYCYPECDFKSMGRDHFKRHALESHNKAKPFFIMEKTRNLKTIPKLNVTVQNPGRLWSKGFRGP